MVKISKQTVFNLLLRRRGGGGKCGIWSDNDFCDWWGCGLGVFLVQRNYDFSRRDRTTRSNYVNCLRSIKYIIRAQIEDLDISSLLNVTSSLKLLTRCLLMVYKKQRPKLLQTKHANLPLNQNTRHQALSAIVVVHSAQQAAHPPQ